MKTVVVCDHQTVESQDAIAFDLSKGVQNCIGCWSCWWKTPGRCVFHDLDSFYHEYVTADKAVFFVKASKGFVSSGLKNLFDRMIPLYLPYVNYKTGESMHVPRYDKYPDVEFYYDGTFATDESRVIFEEYIKRVFYQFHIKNTKVAPIEEYKAKEAGL